MQTVAREEAARAAREAEEAAAKAFAAAEVAANAETAAKVAAERIDGPRGGVNWAFFNF